MEIPTLETERLTLRPFKVEDFDAYAAMVGDTEVSKFISLGGKPMDRLDAWRSMSAIVGHWHLRGFGQWVAEEKETGTFVGRLGLYFPESWPGRELGYALAQNHWGKGYATEGATAARDYAFETLGWDDVISIISPVNTRSQAVAKRLGESYREDQILKGMTVQIYGLTRADWEKLDR